MIAYPRSTMTELSKRDREEFQRELLKLREEIVVMLASSADSAGPVELDQPTGRLTRMDAIQQQKMLAANRRTAQIRQQQVAAALARIDDDEYGDCLACGEAVDPRRLAANPETPFCFSCQTSREQRRQ